MTTLKEIAAVLDCNERVVRAWIAAGLPVRVRTVRVKIKGRRLTRRRYLADEAALRAWVACRTEAPCSQS